MQHKSKLKPKGLMKRAGLWRWLLGSVAVGAAPGAALAADPALQEIVVTAQRRAENLQQIPIAISAFSAEQLDAKQLVNINEVTRYVPNLQFTTTAGGSGAASGLAIRGIGQVDFITTTDPGVGVYLDGVYIARTTGAALDLADIERVEVLRGPQGTLFGRNTIGGAVSVVTMKPKGDYSVRADFTVGNQKRLDGRASFDLPIVQDQLAAKVAILAKSSDGWGKNVIDPERPERLGRDQDVAGRAMLHWTPAERVAFLLSGDYSKRRGSPLPHGRVHFVPTPTNAPFDDHAGNSVVDPTNTDSLNHLKLDTPLRDDLDVWGVALTSSVGFDSMDLKLITAYRGQNQHSGQDYDGGPEPLVNQNVDGSQWQFSQEVDLSGSHLDDRLKWLLGFYFFTEKGMFDTHAKIDGVPVDILTKNDTDSYAVFGQVTFSLTDQLSVTAGGRWTHEKKGVDVQSFFGGFKLVDTSLLPERPEKTFSAFSPKGSIEYQATPDLLLYASIARGFRSGGFNGRPFSGTDLFPFDAEVSTAYEVGAKTDWLDRRLRINVAGFYTDYDDIQLTAVTQSEGSLIVITGNAGTTKLWGGEIELQALPVEGLEVFAALGYTNNRSLEPKPGFVITAGKHLPMAPEWTANAGFDYSFPLGAFGRGTFGGDWNYRSSYFPQADNNPLDLQKGFSLFNAHFIVEPESARWKFTFWGKNLANTMYKSFGQTSVAEGVSVAWFGRTREFGVTLGIRL